MSDFKVVTCGLCGAENKPEFYGATAFRSYNFWAGEVMNEDDTMVPVVDRFILCPNCQAKVLRILQGKM